MVKFHEALGHRRRQRFDRIVAAARHQQRIGLKEFLLESSEQELAADREETASTEFAGTLVDWMLPEPAGTSILGILRMTGRIILPDGTPTGVDGFAALGWRAAKGWYPPSSGIRHRAFS
jgi:hypothetical protein